MEDSGTTSALRSPSASIDTKHTACAPKTKRTHTHTGFPYSWCKVALQTDTECASPRLALSSPGCRPRSRSQEQGRQAGRGTAARATAPRCPQSAASRVEHQTKPRCQRPIYENAKRHSRMFAESSRSRRVAKLVLLLLLECSPEAEHSRSSAAPAAVVFVAWPRFATCADG